MLWQIGGAQTLGLSKDSMEEIRSAAQGMLSVIHDNKKRRAQDILQGTIEHLAGRPSEFINGVKTAIVAAKMVLPKDDPSILSAQQVVKNAEENQRDENINGKTTKHAKQPNRGNHRHSISADAQKAKATDVRPSDDWQMHDSTSNFTDDDGLINATNSTANAIANAEITEPSNTTSVGQMFQWLSCLAVAIVSAAMPIIWRSERTRSEFEFEDTGHKRAEEIHRKSAIAVAKAMANERREKEANANRRRKQKRRENQGAAGYEVEDESNMVNVNNLAAPSTRGTKFHTLHQLETEEIGWEVAGGKFAKDKTHTQSTSSDRQPKDIPKTNQVDATQNLTTGRQAAAEKSPRKYATTEKTQTSELKAATQKKNSKTAATDKKQNRDAKAKNNASNRKAMSSTASNREAAKFSTMTLSGTGSSPQQSSRQAKPPERQHMRSAATSDKQDAQSQTRKKVGETKPAKSSRELKPPAHRGPKKNGNGSVTRPSSAQKPPRDNVVTVSAPQKKQPPRGWNVGNLVPQLVIDKTKPAAHKMLSPANALHVDSNKSKESRVKTSGSSLSSTPQRQVTN